MDETNLHKINKNPFLANVKVEKIPKKTERNNDLELSDVVASTSAQQGDVNCLNTTEKIYVQDNVSTSNKNDNNLVEDIRKFRGIVTYDNYKALNINSTQNTRAIGADSHMQTTDSQFFNLNTLHIYEVHYFLHLALVLILKDEFILKIIAIVQIILGLLSFVPICFKKIYIYKILTIINHLLLIPMPIYSTVKLYSLKGCEVESNAYSEYLMSFLFGMIINLVLLIISLLPVELTKDLAKYFILIVFLICSIVSFVFFDWANALTMQVFQFLFVIYSFERFYFRILYKQTTDDILSIIIIFLILSIFCAGCIILNFVNLINNEILKNATKYANCINN